MINKEYSLGIPTYIYCIPIRYRVMSSRGIVHDFKTDRPDLKCEDQANASSTLDFVPP